MALVAFLRGINVGGYRGFRPSVLAEDLKEFDVVNVGAAGTFIIRKPRSPEKFRAELLRRLPFATKVMLCEAQDILRLETDNPFEATPASSEMVRFVSVLPRACDPDATLPLELPSGEEWLVRVISQRGRFVFGMYRRRMKTIGYLGRLDKIFGAPATTRNWNTILAVTRILKKPGKVKLNTRS